MTIKDIISLLPAKKEKKLECRKCEDYKKHGSTYCLDCEIDSVVYGANTMLDEVTSALSKITIPELSLREELKKLDKICSCKDPDYICMICDGWMMHDV